MSCGLEKNTDLVNALSHSELRIIQCVLWPLRFFANISEDMTHTSKFSAIVEKESSF